MLRGLQSCQLQVALANKGVLMTGRAEGKDSAALYSDVFAQFTWDPSKAQSNSDAVSLRLGMSEQQFAEFKSKHPAAKTISPALFNDYTVAYNYVPNFKTFAPFVQCTSSIPFQVKRYSLTPPVSRSDQQLTFNCTSSDVFPPPPFQMLLSSSAGNESVAVSSLQRTNGLCRITVSRSSPLLHAPPVDDWSNQWTCDPRYFADNSTCDCSCGAPDPDCLSNDRVVNGCSWETPLCDHWGRCSAHETSTMPFRVYLSTPCSSLNLAGWWSFSKQRARYPLDALNFTSPFDFHVQVAASCADTLRFHRNHSPSVFPAQTMP
jgi:hypothetical protein